MPDDERQIGHSVGIFNTAIIRGVIPVKIQMPDGEVELITKKEAYRFIMNHCCGCSWSDPSHPCTGAMIMKCRDQMRYIVDHKDELLD